MINHPQHEPRPAARAIVFNGDSLLVMKRNKFGKRYISLVGGRLEPGEEAEDAVLREVFEETGLRVGSPKLIFVEAPSEQWGKQYIFLCSYLGGEPTLQHDSEEYEKEQSGNLYEPCWLSFKDFENTEIPFRSERLRVEILHAIKNGFSEDVKEWTP